MRNDRTMACGIYSMQQCFPKSDVDGISVVVSRKRDIFARKDLARQICLSFSWHCFFVEKILDNRFFFRNRSFGLMKCHSVGGETQVLIFIMLSQKERNRAGLNVSEQSNLQKSQNLKRMRENESGSHWHWVNRGQQRSTEISDSCRESITFWSHVSARKRLAARSLLALSKVPIMDSLILATIQSKRLISVETEMN